MWINVTDLDERSWSSARAIARHRARVVLVLVRSTAPVTREEHDPTVGKGSEHTGGARHRA